MGGQWESEKKLALVEVGRVKHAARGVELSKKLELGYSGTGTGGSYPLLLELLAVLLYLWLASD